MESGSVTLPSPQNTAWEYDDSRHGHDAASLNNQKTATESPFLASSPSSDLAGKNYDVFLSFRGSETRTGFTDVLHRSLTDAGIDVFRDNDDLPVGQEIKPTLIEVIKRSEVLIPIISRDYASSKSCLMELVQILECKRTMSREIIPIFYDIEPSDVKDQRNSFEKSFLEHQRNEVDAKTIQKWKLAFKEIGRLKGFETAKIHGGHHSKIMDIIIPFVLHTLKKGLLPMIESPVGVDHDVQEIMKMLGVVHRNGQAIEICGSDVRVLGIYGIGGVGKTTLAKAVYNQLYGCFEGYSHLNIPNLRQDEMTLSLRNKLISDLRKKTATYRCSNDARTALAERFRDKRVLILLDGVDDVRQLNLVVEELSWFGPGSRIIVTSRKKDILLKFGKAEIYDVQLMEEKKALQLFSKHAFGRDYPDNSFEDLSMKIVKAAGRLPLALEVTGCRLFKKSRRIWEETLDKLQRAPPEEVEHVLMISFNDLDKYAKQIFLDIACFPIGKDKRIASYMWRDCGLYPSSGIEALHVMSLVKIGKNKELLMHDLLKTLGREIVLDEDRIPGNRSRLWERHEALSTIRKREGTANVVALGLTFDGGSDAFFMPEDFVSFPNLRFLMLEQSEMRGDFNGVLLGLRWLHWGRGHKIFNFLIFSPENLVILDLSWSTVADDCNGWTQIIQKANKLKVLDLTGCCQLFKTPCFPADSKLERLILEECSYLSVIHKSIGNLKKLKSLNIKSTPIVLLPEEMRYLDNLKELLIDNTSICHLNFLGGSMCKLKILSASSCKNLAEISDDIGSLRSLSYLALDEAIIPGLPNSVKLLKGLAELSLRDCREITALPDSIGMLKSLQKMDLSNTRIITLPESIKNLDKLEELKMRNTHISKFPKDITNLGKLQVLTFSGCQSMKGNIPCDILGLSSLTILNLSCTLICSLPKSICQLSHLQTLHLLGCDELQTLPRLPSSLVSLHWGTNNMRIVPDFSNLTNLKVLELVNDPDEEETSSFEPSLTESFGWISSLSHLETLKLCLPNVTSLLEKFNALPQLKTLDLSCINLLNLPQFPSSLSKLILKNCKSQTVDFSNLKTLSELELCDCDASEILGLGDLTLLQVLKISGCNMKNLDGLEQASRLRRFSMSACHSLERSPDLSNCASLEINDICNDQD